MATITIRGLDDVIKERLRARAFRHGCSMSEEAPGILNAALSSKALPGRNLAESIRWRFPEALRWLATQPPSRLYCSITLFDPWNT